MKLICDPNLALRLFADPNFALPSSHSVNVQFELFTLHHLPRMSSLRFDLRAAYL